MGKSKRKPKSKLKKALKNYYRPTPVFWRKLGDALLGVSFIITGSTLYAGYKWVPMVSLTTGVVGKFLSNMFSDDNDIWFTKARWGRFRRRYREEDRYGGDGYGGDYSRTAEPRPEDRPYPPNNNDVDNTL